MFHWLLTKFKADVLPDILNSYISVPQLLSLILSFIDVHALKSSMQLSCKISPIINTVVLSEDNTPEELYFLYVPCTKKDKSTVRLSLQKYPQLIYNITFPSYNFYNLR